MLIAVSSIVGHAPGAWACSCAFQSDAQHLERADVVFIATATGHEDPRAGELVQSSGDRVAWIFDVESAQKGTVSDPAEVRTSPDEAGCGFTFVQGRRYQVFATRGEDGLTTGLCAGTRDLAQQAAYRPAGSNGTIEGASGGPAAPLPASGGPSGITALPALLLIAAAGGAALMRRAARARPRRSPS